MTDIPLPQPARFVTIAAVCGSQSETLEGWLAAHAGLHEQTPPDSAAAFLFGGLAWNLCLLIGQRWFETGMPPALSPDILVAAQWERWHEGDEEGDHIVFRFEAPWNGDADTAISSPSQLADELAALLAPLIERLASSARLPKSAQWRLLGDSITGALLEAGQPLGQSALAMERAQALLAACRSPIANPQVGFVPIEASTADGAMHRRWFRRRGGCCRYYKVEGGAYCTTCVLRDDASRNARLQAHVERELAASLG